MHLIFICWLWRKPLESREVSIIIRLYVMMTNNQIIIEASPNLRDLSLYKPMVLVILPLPRLFQNCIEFSFNILCVWPLHANNKENLLNLERFILLFDYWLSLRKTMNFIILSFPLLFLHCTELSFNVLCI